MLSKVLVFFCGAQLFSPIAIQAEKGFLSQLFSDKSASIHDNGPNWISPQDINDGCDREYPVTSHTPRGIEIAYKRYRVSPQVIPFPPEDYMEVSYPFNFKRHKTWVDNFFVLVCLQIRLHTTALRAVNPILVTRWMFAA